MMFNQGQLSDFAIQNQELVFRLSWVLGSAEHVVEAARWSKEQYGDVPIPPILASTIATLEAALDDYRTLMEAQDENN